MFNPGDRVRVLQHGRRRAVAVVRVVSDDRSELKVEQQIRGQNVKTTFAHIKEFGGFKVLFEDLDGRRCFSQCGPTYDIVKA